MAKLYFKYGAMSCGKTTELLQVVYNYQKNNFNVILVKPEVDKKGDTKVVSRLGVEKEVDYILCEDTRNSIKLLNHFEIKRVYVLWIAIFFMLIIYLYLIFSKKQKQDF